MSCYTNLFQSIVVCGESMWLLNLWNLKYLIALACVLPSIISPIMLVTSRTVGNDLLSICRCKTHDPRLCTDCPPYVSICTLGGSRFHIIPDQIVAELCGLVECCSQLLYQLHSQSERVGTLETELLTMV